MAADLDRGAVEPDRSDVVLAAAVRAAAHLQVDLAGQRVGDVHRLDPLLERPVQAHRGGDPELAGVGAGAGDDVGDRADAVLGEAELAQRRVDVVERLIADPAQDEVLIDRRPRVAAAEVAHDLREAAELVRAEVAAGDLHVHGREALLALGVDVVGAERLELRAVAVRAAGRRRSLGRGALLVEVGQQTLDREVALGDPVALELTVDHVAECLDADLVDQHLDPRAGAVDAQPVLTVEDPQGGLGELQVLAVLGRDELGRAPGRCAA